MRFQVGDIISGGWQFAKFVVESISDGQYNGYMTFSNDRALDANDVTRWSIQYADLQFTKVGSVKIAANKLSRKLYPKKVEKEGYLYDKLD